jgi:Ser/Thr protein kinase RdoA (MazF antagonist)
VRAYATLSERGRIGRLRTLAFAAAARFGIDPLSCVCAARSFNTIFRVDDAQGRRSALRVGSSIRIHRDGTEAVEIAWMAALRRDGAVDVPDVIEATDGSSFVDIEVAGVPGRRRCALFTWVPGRPIDERLDPRSAYHVGALAAMLHEHAAAHATTEPPDVATGDRVLYWDAASRLEELVPIYGSLVIEAQDRAQRAIDRLWQSPPHLPHLLHGDLHPSNVFAGADRAVVIDFQDLFWGFEPQDLAITISVIRTYDEPARLLDAFRTGYVSLRPWPEMSTEELDALVASRRIQQLNLGLHVRKPGLDAFVARHAERLRAWMGGG